MVQCPFLYNDVPRVGIYLLSTVETHARLETLPSTSTRRGQPRRCLVGRSCIVSSGES
jgi:hypothetical protein